MKNRIRRFNRENADIENLLTEAEKSINKVFMDFDLSETAGQILPAWKVDLQTIMICEQKGNDELLTDEDTDELIKILNTVNKVIKDPEAPEKTKALLVEMYFRTLIRYYLCKEKYHGEKLFERRAEIEKDNPLRDFFIVRYIDNEVYPRFYEARDEARNKELEAKGIDLEQYYEEYDKNITGEQAEKESREWKEHFNELLREYGESHLIGWEDLKIIKQWQEKLPEDMKREMAEKEQESKRETEIILKLEGLKDEKGITEEEAFKLLTDKEREILKKGGLLGLDGEATP